MAKIDEVDEALNLAEDLSNKYGRATALADIADKLIEEGRKEEAKELLNESVDIAEDIVFSLEKRARAPADIARNISFGVSKKNSLTHISWSAVKNFEEERTRTVLGEYSSIANSISKNHAKASAYSEIVEAMTRIRYDKKAEEILEKSLESDKNISLSITKELKPSATSLKL